jgi:hypothetical protein
MQTQDKIHGLPAPPMVVQPLGSVTVDPMKGYNHVEVIKIHFINPKQNKLLTRFPFHLTARSSLKQQSFARRLSTTQLRQPTKW